MESNATNHETGLATPTPAALALPATPTPAAVVHGAQELPRLMLEDGRIAQFVCKPKALHASKAIRTAGANGNEVDRSAALLSQLVKIDGEKVSMGDILALELSDYNALQAMMPGKSSAQMEGSGSQEETNS